MFHQCDGTHTIFLEYTHQNLQTDDLKLFRQKKSNTFDTVVVQSCLDGTAMLTFPYRSGALLSFLAIATSQPVAIGLDGPQHCVIVEKHPILVFALQVSFVPISATAGPSHQHPAATSGQTQGVSPDKKRKRDSNDGSDGSHDNGNDVRHRADRVHVSDTSDRDHKDDSDSRRRHGKELDKGDRDGHRARDEGRSKGGKHSRHSRRQSSDSDSDRSPERAEQHVEAGQAAAAGAADNDRYTDAVILLQPSQ